MKKGLLIGVLSGLGGVVVGIGGIFVYGIMRGQSADKIHYETTWKYNNGTRAIMKDYEITKDLTKSHKYDESTFKKYFPESESKTSKSIINKSFKFAYKDVYQNAVNVANALEEFDNVLGWESPKNRTIDPVTGNSVVAHYNFGNINDAWHATGKIPQDSAFIWFAGGPQGEHNLGQTTVASNVYSKYGRVFTFRQAQHGFVPSRVVIMDYFGDTPAVKAAILTHDKSMLPKTPAGHQTIWKRYKNHSGSEDILKKIKNLDLETEDALPVIANMNKEDLPKMLLAYSMAITKVDADNTLAFRDAIAKKYIAGTNGQTAITKFYEGGISYGFTEAVNSAIYGEDWNDNKKVEDGKFSKIIASSNSLSSALPGSIRVTGGMLTKENEKTYKGESGTVDPVFALSIETQKIVFGQMAPLATRLKEPTFKTFAEKNILFTANKDDWNIGDIGQKEKDFYNTHNLKHHVEINNKMGHNNIPWKEYNDFMK